VTAGADWRAERAEVGALVPPAPRLGALLRAVAEEWAVSPGELLSPRRPMRLAEPRQALFGLARELTRHSLPAIGRVFARDHTTVRHGALRHAQRLANPAYAARIAALRARLTEEKEG
jgi:chromosomal replication initiation ATPase DnaA